MWSVLKSWSGESKSNEEAESAEAPAFPPEWLCELKDPFYWFLRLRAHSRLGGQNGGGAWLSDTALDASMPASQQKLGLMLQSEFSAIDAQSLDALQLKRLAASQRQPPQFDDLANLAIRD